MLRKDTVWVGMLFGLVFPGIGYVLFSELNEVFIKYYFHGGVGFSVAFRMIVSVCLNLIPFNIFVRTRKDNAMKGVLLDTFVSFFLILFLYFKREMFS